MLRAMEAARQRTKGNAAHVTRRHRPRGRLPCCCCLVGGQRAGGRLPNRRGPAAIELAQHARAPKWAVGPFVLQGHAAKSPTCRRWWQGWGMLRRAYRKRRGPGLVHASDLGQGGARQRPGQVVGKVSPGALLIHQLLVEGPERLDVRAALEVAVAPHAVAGA